MFEIRLGMIRSTYQNPMLATNIPLQPIWLERLSPVCAFSKTFVFVSKMTDVLQYTILAFGTVNHELHLKRRAALAPIFSKRAIQGSEPLIKKHIKLLVASFENSVISCKPLSLETTFLAFSTDFIGSYAFNLDFNLLKDAEAAADWRKTLDSVAVSTVAARQFPWLIYFILSIPRVLVRPFFPDICRLLDAYVVSSYEEKFGFESMDAFLSRTNKNYV